MSSQNCCHLEKVLKWPIRILGRFRGALTLPALSQDRIAVSFLRVGPFLNGFSIRGSKTSDHKSC